MSEKWELEGLDKFEPGLDAEWEWCIESGDEDLIAKVPTGEPENAAARAAEKPKAIAQQIVREHNAHDALVEALRYALHALVPGPYDSRGAIEHNREAAAVKVRAALALAAEK